MPFFPLVVNDSGATAAGVTTRVYRNRLAETLGYFVSGTIRTTATSLEAERRVISSDLQSPALPADRYDGYFISIVDGADAGQVRRLMPGAYHSPSGSLLVDRGFSAPLAAGVSFEIAILPATRDLGVLGLLECLNEGLEKLPLVDIVPVTAVDQQSQYPFFAYPWPIRGISGVYYPRTSTTNERRRPVPSSYWRFIPDVDASSISFRSLPFSAGDVFEVGLVRPATTWIKHTGVWGDSTAGLQDDDDAALYDALTVVNMARPIALERLALTHPKGSKERADILSESQDARTTAGYARFFGGYRGSGVQKVGAGRRNSWWWDR